MNNVTAKYWDILTKDEQTAITLSLSFDKSTWEAGEIMGKPHYKFLEIKTRAEKFLQLFSSYFNQYDSLIPPGIPLTPTFMQYISQAILDRKPIADIVESLEDTRYLIISARTRLIVVELDKLIKANTKHTLALHGLITEFDRWNNTRILPPTLQQLSGFKRRNKAKNLKHFKNLTKLHSLSVAKLIAENTYSGKYTTLYSIVISQHLPEHYRVLSFKEEARRIDYFNSLGFPVFKDRADVEGFGKLMVAYLYNPDKTCKMGQIFWPKFRDYMDKTDNFVSLNNISRTKAYLEKLL